MRLDFQSGDSEVMRGFGVLLKYTTLLLWAFLFLVFTVGGGWEN